MKENKYDDDVFFEKYSQMDRSQKGLSGAGEWETLEKALPDFQGKKVLDLGCGYGWHCIYAAEHGAELAVGTDISQKMIKTAREKSGDLPIEYRVSPMEDLEFEADSFDVVLSSLAFHYIESFEDMAEKVNRWLKTGGEFIFSAEHPVFTAYGSQDWYYDENGTILHFPVDNYFYEGKRDAVFLGEKVTKYHKTLTTYLNGLLENGFMITHVIEPKPSEKMMAEIETMRDEMRRPMMLIVSAVKK